MKTIKVNDCNDCPFQEFTKSWNYFQCVHDYGLPELIKAEDEFSIIHPDWCPLKKESIKIELK